METKWLLLCFVLQAICYLLILLYIWYNYRKNGDKKDTKMKSPKLKTEFVEAKLLRTPADKIRAWMDTAQFRIIPEPDLELAFPPLPKLQFETMDTPRLIGDTLPGRVSVIAQDIETVTPNVVQVEADDGDSEYHSRSSSTPDQPPKQNQDRVH
eukprot:g6439.t1